MRRILTLAFFAMSFSLWMWAQQAGGQGADLGQTARDSRTRSQQSTRKVWTNDDFTSSAPKPTPKPVQKQQVDPYGESPDTTTEPKSTEAQKTESQKKEAEPDKEKPKAEDPAETQKKLDNEWQTKIAAERAKIESSKRELDLIDREYRLKASSYYADPGNRLRDPKGWQDSEQEYRTKSAELKQQIAEGESKIADMQEEARKAGASHSAFE